jgi:hypothetical protein
MYNDYELIRLAKENVRDAMDQAARYRLYRQAKAGQPDRWANLLLKLASLATKTSEQLKVAALKGNQIKPLTT